MRVGVSNNRLVASVLLVAVMVVALFGIAACGSSDNSSSAQSTSSINVSLKVDGTDGDHGVIYDGSVQVPEGSNVYDVLVASEVEMSSKQAMGMGAYVESIDGLREREKGPSSGWLFSVNGKVASVSCDQYEVADGDSVEWAYRIDALNE